VAWPKKDSKKLCSRTSELEDEEENDPSWSKTLWRARKDICSGPGHFQRFGGFPRRSPLHGEREVRALHVADISLGLLVPAFGSTHSTHEFLECIVLVRRLAGMSVAG
jgi:hypothetical protein